MSDFDVDAHIETHMLSHWMPEECLTCALVAEVRRLRLQFDGPSVDEWMEMLNEQKAEVRKLREELAAERQAANDAISEADHWQALALREGQS